MQGFIGDKNNKAREVSMRLLVGDKNNKARPILKVLIGDKNNRARVVYIYEQEQLLTIVNIYDSLSGELIKTFTDTDCKLIQIEIGHDQNDNVSYLFLTGWANNYEDEPHNLGQIDNSDIVMSGSYEYYPSYAGLSIANDNDTNDVGDIHLDTAVDLEPGKEYTYYLLYDGERVAIDGKKYWIPNYETTWDEAVNGNLVPSDIGSGIYAFVFKGNYILYPYSSDTGQHILGPGSSYVTKTCIAPEYKDVGSMYVTDVGDTWEEAISKTIYDSPTSDYFVNDFYIRDNKIYFRYPYGDDTVVVKYKDGNYVAPSDEIISDYNYVYEQVENKSTIINLYSSLYDVNTGNIDTVFMGTYTSQSDSPTISSIPGENGYNKIALDGNEIHPTIGTVFGYSNSGVATSLHFLNDTIVFETNQECADEIALYEHKLQTGKIYTLYVYNIDDYIENSGIYFCCTLDGKLAMCDFIPSCFGEMFDLQGAWDDYATDRNIYLVIQNKSNNKYLCDAQGCPVSVDTSIQSEMHYTSINLDTVSFQIQTNGENINYDVLYGIQWISFVQSINFNPYDWDNDGYIYNNVTLDYIYLKDTNTGDLRKVKWDDRIIVNAIYFEGNIENEGPPEEIIECPICGYPYNYAEHGNYCSNCGNNWMICDNCDYLGTEEEWNAAEAGNGHCPSCGY